MASKTSNVVARALNDNIALFNIVRSTCNPSFISRVNEATQANFAQLANTMTSAQYQQEFNEWINGAVNLIARQVINSNYIYNRLEKYIAGNMEFGDTVQEFAVQVQEAEDYNMTDPGIDWVNPFRISNPDVRVLYHRNPRQKKFRITTYPEQAKKAFLSEGGLGRLILNIISQLEKSCALDNWYTMKELMNVYIQNNNADLPLRPDQIQEFPDITDEETGKEFILAMKNLISDLAFPTGCFNQQGIVTMTRPADLTFFLRKEYANIIPVQVLSSAFNREDLALTPAGEEGTLTIELMDDFGGRYPVDAGGNRLYPIFNAYGKVTGTYAATQGGTTPVDVDHWEDPNSDVIGILADNNFFLVTNRLHEYYTIWNPDGLYMNHFLHDWKDFGFWGTGTNIIIKKPASPPIA